MNGSMHQRKPATWNDCDAARFEPDVILPAQFFRTVHGDEAHRGERNLIIAVLEDAITCFQKNLFARDTRGRRLFREAEQWMMTGDRGLPYSFENICEFLWLNPEYLRDRLRTWVRTAEARAGRRQDSAGGAVPRASLPT